MKYYAYVLAAAIVASACQHEVNDVKRFNGLRKRLLTKRQEQPRFPPELDGDESILVNSFDATEIDTWSYYYTHGLHIAGTNQSMAQWTADRWAEHGFTTGLDVYCMPMALARGI